MQTWIVCSRSDTGAERPIGLVEASSELAALFRARTKVSQLHRGVEPESIVIRAADHQS